MVAGNRIRSAWFNMVWNSFNAIIFGYALDSWRIMVGISMCFCFICFKRIFWQFSIILLYVHSFCLCFVCVLFLHKVRANKKILILIVFKPGKWEFSYMVVSSLNFLAVFSVCYWGLSKAVSLYHENEKENMRIEKEKSKSQNTSEMKIRATKSAKSRMQYCCTIVDWPKKYKKEFNVRVQFSYLDIVPPEMTETNIFNNFKIKFIQWFDIKSLNKLSKISCFFKLLLFILLYHTIAIIYCYTKT